MILEVILRFAYSKVTYKINTILYSAQLIIIIIILIISEVNLKRKKLV